MKKTLLIVISAIGVAGLASVQAQLIDVDFNGNSVGNAYGGVVPGSTGPVTGPNQSGAALLGSAGDIWNGFTDAQMGFTDQANVAGPISASGLALNYADGTSSGVTMSLTASSTYDAQSFNNHSAFVTANSPYQNLMQDLLVANTPQTVTLSGLTANQTFNLVLYNAGDNNLGSSGGIRTSSFTVNGVTQTSTWDGTTSTLVAGVSYVDYASATSDGSGNLVITYGPGTGFSEGDLDGFQLQVVPEPSNLAILGVAGMMLFVWRRRLVCS